MTESLQVAVDRLVGMGSTKLIAEYLRDGGYFTNAIRESPFSCPLGKYLTARTGKVYGIAPETGIFTIKKGLCMRTPYILKQFIYRYDGCLGFDDVQSPYGGTTGKR